MGYELTFHYHERNEDDGKYNTEETKTFTKSVGRKSAEVPLEQVAAVVMGQLARRDVWIINVEIAEFARREVTFKETKEGVVIKNRKFSYNQVADHLVSEEEDSEPLPLSQSCQMPQMPQMKQQIIPRRDPNVPIRHEIFRPCREDYGELQRQGIKLSMGKTYPIFNEAVKFVNGPYGGVETIYYTVTDDTGQKMEVSGGFFEPVPRGLSFTGIQGYNARPQEGKLSYVDTSPISGNGGNLDAMIAAQDAALARRG